MEEVELYNENCAVTLQRLPDHCIDLMLTDPPYGLTQNEWDEAIDLHSLWGQWERIVKPNGAFIFTSAQPFTSELVISRRQLFKYDIIWHKPLGSGFLNARKMPMRNHEHILVFYKQQPPYNPQMWLGANNKKGIRQTYKSGGNYRPVGTQNKKEYFDDGGKRFPTSVITITNGNRNQHDVFHPTQKPVDLFRYLVRTYSNPGDIIFDGYAGSGTTAIACIREGRRFVGAESHSVYYAKATKRIVLEQQWQKNSNIKF